MAKHPVTGLILAAGMGKRMKSSLPKVLHPVCGLTMVEWVIRAMAVAGVAKPILVVGHGGDQVQAALGNPKFEYVWQTEQLGTGHAVLTAADALRGHDGVVLVTAGDMPLLEGASLQVLVDKQDATGAAVVMATTELPHPRAYGRIVRDAGGKFQQIVEEKDCTEAQKQIREVNPSVYCFSIPKLLAALPSLGNQNAAGEYYLTDIPAILLGMGEQVETVFVADHLQFTGVNDRWQLAEVNGLRQRQILQKVAESGVTLIDPNSTFIGPDVVIGEDCVVQPNTVIEGATRVGKRCQLGPNSWIKESILGDGCRVFMSHLDQATMRDGARCGPFANLRPMAELGAGVKIGNFVEIKNSTVGKDTSISHLSYIGDSAVGESTNVGAGTITCNYDGFSKHRTEIGDRVFVGSNSTLVAPVSIGDDSMVAAGSVITTDVPSGAMAIGRGRQENKEEWYRAWREKKAAHK